MGHFFPIKFRGRIFPRKFREWQKASAGSRYRCVFWKEWKKGSEWFFWGRSRRNGRRSSSATRRRELYCCCYCILRSNGKKKKLLRHCNGGRIAEGWRRERGGEEREAFWNEPLLSIWREREKGLVCWWSFCNFWCCLSVVMDVQKIKFKQNEK